MFGREIEDTINENIGKLRFCILFKAEKCWKIVIGPMGIVEGDAQVIPYVDKYEYFDRICDHIDKTISDLPT